MSKKKIAIRMLDMRADPNLAEEMTTQHARVDCEA
jgi:hypothetical protein